MAEPARKLDPDDIYDEPSGTNPSDPRPELRALEGGGETSEPKRGHLSQVDNDQPSREQLADAEDNALQSQPQHENQLGRGYRRGQPGHSRLSWNGRITRRRALFGGGVIGTIIVLLAFFINTVGPFEFIHIAQMMERFHFSHQEDAGDIRMSKLYRYMRSGGNAGETRVGWLGSKMHASMLADLERIGLKPDYGGLTTYEGFTIDKENPHSPYKGMGDEEIRSVLAQKGVTGISVDNGKVTVTAEGYFKKFLARRATQKSLVGELGYSRVSGAVRVRVMAKYGLVSWHPMKILDRRLNQKISILYDEWKKAREERLKTGAGSTELRTSGAREQTGVDKDGKPIFGDLSEPDSPVSSERVTNTLNKVLASKSLRITGGAASATGIVCAINTVRQNMGDIRYVQVVAPLTRMGMDSVTVGNQIMSGQDVSSTEVGFLAKNFNEVDSKGNIVSSWDDAQSIKAELGQPGGIDIHQEVQGTDSAQKAQSGIKEALAGDVPGWISWTDTKSVADLCSKIGQAIAGVVSITLSILTGGLFTAVGQIAAGAVAGQFVIDKISHLLAGETVNVAATGAQWGNNINYGSRLGANAMALQFGGTALSNSQTAQLKATQTAISDAQFKSKNIAYKLFYPKDYRTVASKFIDNSSPNVSQNVNKLASVFLNAGHIFSSIPKLFTNHVNAAAEPYDYGFPEYGYSQEDLDNPAVEDPYANADAAAAILNDKTNGQKYIDKARKCFGVDIKKVAYPTDEANKPRWDVIPADTGDKPYVVNPYDPDPSHYPPDCAAPSGLNQASWLKVRFFIFDTGIMEGYACYQGDSQSCDNDGFEDSGN